MIVIPRWESPAEIEHDIPQIRRLREYWESLNDGQVPERDQLYPEAIKDLLPFMIMVDFEFDPFRVKYRLTGTQVDQDTGYNLTGRYLDEFFIEPFKDGLTQFHETLESVAKTGRPHIGTYQWTSPWPVQLKMPFGIFPLSVRGVITQAIAIERAYKPTPTFETTTWRDYLAIHDAGGPSEKELLNFL